MNSLSMDELCSLADLPRRTVRYYIQIGLLDRPEGETRAARYGQAHLERLLRIRRWSAQGLSLERIRGLLAEADAEPVSGLGAVAPRSRAGTIELWSHLVLADGVELRLDPARAGLAPEQVSTFFAAVMAAYRQLHPEDPAA